MHSQIGFYFQRSLIALLQIHRFNLRIVSSNSLNNKFNENTNIINRRMRIIDIYHPEDFYFIERNLQGIL